MARTGKKNPSDIWFWDDYENDAALRSVSLCAQGLWMRMLCVAARAERRGFVEMGSEPCTVENLAGPLARLVGEGKEKVMDLLDELVRAGVPGVTRQGILYCRRMVRAANLSKTRAKAGQKGAAVTNGQIREKSGLPQQNDGKEPGKASASGTRLHSSIFNNPLNPPASGAPEIGEGKGDGPPAVIAGMTLAELRVKAAALVRGGPGSETTARGLGDAVIREMVRHGLLSPEVAQRYGVKVPRAA
ncbi:hypothetical protein [Niveispirillum sp.]|uniref:hypothetical protein n=1 Tax=Niveispirillum sp. TaxID=1917217 RepID=UPI001B6F3E60|nr:hypothetical protein [Niveispirillum sp.]MBP7339426.1 hypothetical protein [Niveispirillum sp.]